MNPNKNDKRCREKSLHNSDYCDDCVFDALVVENSRLVALTARVAELEGHNKLLRDTQRANEPELRHAVETLYANGAAMAETVQDLRQANASLTKELAAARRIWSQAAQKLAAEGDAAFVWLEKDKLVAENARVLKLLQPLVDHSASPGCWDPTHHKPGMAEHKKCEREQSEWSEALGEARKLFDPSATPQEAQQNWDAVAAAMKQPAETKRLRSENVRLTERLIAAGVDPADVADANCVHCGVSRRFHDAEKQTCPGLRRTTTWVPALQPKETPR
jgi:flagellar biosynthesis regulator FlaF